MSRTAGDAQESLPVSACAPPRADAVRRRETLLWLAELASWHSGTVAQLVKTYGTVAEAADRPRDELAALVARSRRTGERERAEVSHFADGRGVAEDEEKPGGEGAAWRAALLRRGPQKAAPADASGLAFVCTDGLYPARLRELPDPPPAVFVAAAPDGCRICARLRLLERRPCVAVVGTREPSAYGLDMAALVAADLAGEGVVVVSGLARGVDAAAHRAALGRAGDDELATVAVVAGGADVCSPASHRTLRERVMGRGLVLSEFVWGTSARAWRFPARNRVMAALSDAVVVVEGTSRSGALITARHGKRLGRVRLAVPGECGRALTEGPHALLRTGAALCESAASVRAALAQAEEERPGTLRGPVRDWLERQKRPAGRRGRGSDPTAIALPAEQRAIIAALEHAPAGLDRLIETSGLSPAATLAAVGALEVAGLVGAEPGGVYRPVRGRPTGSRGR
jgi:DNA processing protein